jgi:hypothetical protein
VAIHKHTLFFIISGKQAFDVFGKEQQLLVKDTSSVLGKK